ncbi:MAG: hypothetical protein A2Z99_08315 [Treponema sp. GWB1_62_6]|nr:MAG: hypothetical protein A2Z99_08315 [Treponema sp. GWB1_62_6]
MASVTLVESAKLSDNELIAGVIENVITVNQMYEALPFETIDGNALQYTRENALGAVQLGTVGTEIVAGKAAATFTSVTSALTTIVGDAEVNGLIQATRSSHTDQTGSQVASKAKSAGRQFQDMLVNGTGINNQFTGLLALVDATKIVAQDGALSFALLDNLIDLVTDKDGEVDYFAMNARTRRSFFNLVRSLGGASVTEVVQLPNGATVPAYRSIPIFRNDYIPVNQTAGSLTNCTTVLAGTFDDGSESIGIAGLTAANDGGIVIKDVGEHQTRDEHITRVLWYCGLALFNLNGLAAGTGVTN